MTIPLFCYGIPLLFPILHFLKKNRLIGSMLVVAGIFYELVDCLLLHKEIIKQKEWRRKQKRLKNGKRVTLPTPFFFSRPVSLPREKYISNTIIQIHTWMARLCDILWYICSAEYSMMCDMTVCVAPWISLCYWNLLLEEVCQKTTIFVVQNQFHLCELLTCLLSLFCLFFIIKVHCDKVG